ncbi:TetR/AcrR family transcriptional regulator C-terminal domain-containing protein [Bailinhaonella thermotolerans]|uniref:Transcriptional regulator TetR C-terminal Proteobacteria type domain-containing protein n=1 Tax=Bailinhaonella thermotolerans TaxID=1070861 RepID=A0A3A4B021_9ACTN|nr:TetR/AcrR family transcriptional regulator C-terminal domain-containing protein [Bailinhaonella thermotolerans]RJL27248.1 hypothetical protein D5H75_26025 [Bailinhaonella thermotolerans]
MAIAINHPDDPAYRDLHERLQDTRRRVLEMSLLIRPEATGIRDAHNEPAGLNQAVDTFLALLQDRLPAWLRTLDTLIERAGKGNVTDNLIPVARAAIDYYADVQGNALPAFASPAVAVRFRHAFGALDLGPGNEVSALSRYIAAEQSQGRITTDADPDATARLLLAGCFRHAFYEIFFGLDSVPSRDVAAKETVTQLRLDPRP